MTINKSAADEILTNMAGQLKIASVVDEFRQALQSADTVEEVDAVCSKYRGALRREPTQQDWQMLCNIRKNQIKQEKSAAVSLALQKIIEAADILDSSGLETYASEIDKLITRITSK